MPSTPEEFRRIIRRLIQHEVIRTGLGAAVMMALYLAGYAFLIATGLALATYVGLWLLTDTPETARVTSTEPAYRDVLEAFERCQELSGLIKAHLESITNSLIFDCASRISLSATQVIDTMLEERKLEASLAVREPLARADKILTRYARIGRRGWDIEEVQDRVLTYLSTIAQTLDRILFELNRQAVLDLETLGETTQEDLEKVPDEIPSLPPRLPADARSSLPDDVRRLLESLSPREFEVLRHLPAGRTDQEIADALFLSKRTVSDHVANLCAKLGVRNRTEAGAFAARLGLDGEGPSPPADPT